MKIIEKLKKKYNYIVETIDTDLMVLYKWNYIKIFAFIIMTIIVNVIFTRSNTINILIVPIGLCLLVINTITIIYTAYSKIYILYGTVVRISEEDEYEIDNKSKHSRKNTGIFKVYIKSDYNEYYYLVKLPLLKMMQYQKGTKIKCFFHERYLSPINENTAKISRYLHILSTKIIEDKG